MLNKKQGRIRYLEEEQGSLQGSMRENKQEM